ncbi:MAG: hypothetical protein Q8N18_24075 [Opitutaceae bacterium]|nr:hypothetical protein [Opitutaceae bacterium]
MTAAAEPRRWWAWRLAAAAAIAAILFARKSHALLTPQFWAEDILVFFDQSLRLGPAAIFEPYGGYLHLLPRLVAAFGALLDPAAGPLLYNAAAGLITSAVLASLVSPRTGPLGLGLALALLPVLLPHSGEVFLNLTNVQWFTALLFFAALIKAEPATRGGSCAEAAALGVAGLTGPFGVLLLPAFAWRAWSERSAHAARLLAAVGTTAAVQLWVLLRTPPSTPAQLRFDAEASVRILADRLGVQTFFAGGVAVPTTLALVLLAGLLGAATWAAMRSGPHRPARVALLLFPAVMLALVLVRFRELLALFQSHDNGDRYFWIARACLGWLALLAAAGGATRRVRLACLLPPALAVLAALTVNFRFTPWTDLRWPEQAAILRRGAPARIPIQPAPWTYDFPGRPPR